MRKFLGIILILAGVAILGVSARLGNPLADDRRYLILLQNQMELRPTGGFLGSYAIAQIKNGKLINLAVQDIYEPDGRVTEHIEAPEPIQEAFQLGTLRLRDANWDPDFPKTAETLMWYLKKAGEGEFGGVIATNLLVFQEILREIGPVGLSDYGEQISAENLWEKAQFYSQENFFPGSKQKREFLGDLSTALRNRLKTSSWREKIRLIKLIIKLLAEEQIMVYSSDDKIQSAISAAGWSGEVKTEACPAWLPNCIADSLLAVEANLGVNKANCCLERRAALEIEPREGEIRHRLTLTYANYSGDSAWGGKYKAWVRVRVPFSAGGEKGFWAEVPVGEKREYSVEYNLPINQYQIDQPIFLLVQKQSGISDLPLELATEKNGRESIRNLIIRKDTALTIR